MIELRSLVISIKDDVLVGCYDLISVFGGETEDNSPEAVVSAILEALIDGIQEDGLISVYEHEEELQARLEFFIPSLNRENEVQKIAKQVTAELAGSESFESIQKKLEEPNPTEMNEDVSVDPTSVKELAFSELPKDDELVKEAKGSLSKQRALCLIYSRLPREQWGSDKSREMYQMFLDVASDKPKTGE